MQRRIAAVARVVGQGQRLAREIARALGEQQLAAQRGRQLRIFEPFGHGTRRVQHLQLAARALPVVAHIGQRAAAEQGGKHGR
ncbi:hypothetical protein D3C78_1628620 [compost metagenome]